MSEQDRTIAAKHNTEVLNKNAPPTHIDIFYCGKELSLASADLPIKLGRDYTTCQIVVNSDVVSRVHCSIEVRDGQIGLADSSTNGTFIRIGRNESFVIKDSFYPLIGKGNIRLGEQFNENESLTIFFRTATR